MSLFTFDAVTCERGGRVLFKALSFALEPGGAALVTGPNGAGKSSLIKIAAGTLRESAGRLSLSSNPALLGEHAALDEELTLTRALSFWAALDDRRDAVPEALDALALTDLSDIPVRLLSTGQRRRAAIARVVASGARLWLLDEPANGLDTVALGLFERAIASHRASGGAVLVASHTPIALPGAQLIELGR